MRLISLGSACALMSVVSACSYVQGPPDPLPYDTVNAIYQCDNGRPLRVTFDRTNRTATVNDLMTLSQAQSGSGFRYASPEHELQGKGNEVLWTVGRSAPLRCTVA